MGQPYQTEPMVLASGQIQKLPGDMISLAIISATYLDDVSISTSGSSFFELPGDGALDFLEPTEVWIRNDNGSTNTIVMGYGTAKFRRSVVNGGTVSVTGSVATTMIDGQPVALGAKADAAATTDTGTFSLIALFKRLLGKFGALIKSTYAVDSLATTNAVTIKASAGRLYSLDAVNTTGAVKVVRFYDLAAAPTVGTDIALLVVAIPANSSVNVRWPEGRSFLVGISVAITGAIAYNDATAVAAHDVQLAASYE